MANIVAVARTTSIHETLSFFCTVQKRAVPARDLHGDPSFIEPFVSRGEIHLRCRPVYL
jgi:hypothetical protein